jgi:single-stranded DNA-binding protein
MNKLTISGALVGDLIKKEIGGRPVCIFALSVHDAARSVNYKVPVLAWDNLCTQVLLDYSEGSLVTVAGKLTTRPVTGSTALRCEVVADSIGPGVNESVVVPAAPDYPAARPNKKRAAAERGAPAAVSDLSAVSVVSAHPVQAELTQRLDLEEVARQELPADAADAAANGVPFELQ